MFNRPRQLLTTGTAMAAVAGALLLGAEDAGLGAYTRAHVDGLSAALWDNAEPSPSRPGAVRAGSSRIHRPAPAR